MAPLPPEGTPLYRGEDRRRIAGPVQSPFGRPYVMAVAFVLLCAAAVTLDLTVSSDWIRQSREIATLLQVASFMVAIALGGIAISRWYLTSDAPALWIGIALLVYGIVRLFVAELLPHVMMDDTVTAIARWARPAAQVVTVAMLARALAMAPVHSSTSGPRLVAGAMGAIVVLAVLFSVVPGLATAVDGGAADRVGAYGVVNQMGIMPFAWGLTAVGFTWRGIRGRRWLLTWMGILLLCLALGDVARVMAAPPVEAGLLGKEILRATGLLLALHGATREILYTYRDGSTRLAKSEYTAMTAEERIRQGQAAAEERAHEARSALAAIEGATKTLEHYRDRLPAETQSALSTAISGEIRRLQRLVSVEEASGEMGPFSLAESLAPIVANERARGVAVDVDVPGDLDAVGRAGATEQVIQTLFDNARKYAPNTRVRVRASREDAWVVLRIEDRGPGVPVSEREAVFRRGVRGDNALEVSGSGLGLYVAAKLIREQGGELWVDDRQGGGASFAIALPAPEALVGTEDAVERLQQSGKLSDGRGLSASERSD